MGAASNLSYFVRDALSSIRGNPATSVFTAITLGFALSIFALFMIIFINLNNAVGTWGDRVHMVAYLKDGAGLFGDRLRKDVISVPGVKDARFVSKEAALTELRGAFKGHEKVLEGIDSNPLPAAYEIKVMDAYKEPALFLTVVERVRKLQFVDDVQYSREWVDKFSAFLKFTEFAALAIGIFLAAATLFIITNTIRLTVYARKDEVEVLRLVGASNWFIKTPFFIEGVIQGAAGGLLASSMLAFGRYVIIDSAPPYLSFIADAPLPMAALAGLLVLSGIFLGAAGSLMSMGKFLKA